jgi:hypothetical protein
MGRSFRGWRYPIDKIMDCGGKNTRKTSADRRAGMDNWWARTVEWINNPCGRHHGGYVPPPSLHIFKVIYSRVSRSSFISLIVEWQRRDLMLGISCSGQSQALQTIKAGNTNKLFIEGKICQAADNSYGKRNMFCRRAVSWFHVELCMFVCG